MKELIYPKEKHFEANGKKYRIDPTLSYDRWIELQSCQLELPFAISFKGLIDANNRAINAFNKLNFVEGSAILYNIKNGLQKIDEKQVPTAFKMCALFINYEGEDVRYFSEPLLQEKINDWQEAGIDVNFFLNVAAHSVPHFFTALKESFQDTSKSKKAEKESPSNT